MKARAEVRYATLGDARRALQSTSADSVPQISTGEYKSLMSRLGVEFQGLTDRMCPVELCSGECVVLVLAEYVRDDAVLAMVIAMQQIGLPIANHALVVVTAAQLGVAARQNRAVLPAAKSLKTAGVTPGHVLFSLLDDMLLWAVEHGASDVHLYAMHAEPNAEVAFSVRSRLQRPECFTGIATDMMLELMAVVWMRIEGGNGAVFEPLREQQGRLVRWIAGRAISLRWASIGSQRGPSVTLRLLARDMSPMLLTLAQLGYDERQRGCFDRALLATGGAVILAGAVGSGKSTTLASLIRSLPSDRKVMTLEDPIEFDLPNAVQCAVTSFGEGEHDDVRFDLKLRAIKRSAANDVLIGEIRDHGSARAFSDLLMAGTNIYTTIHAGSAGQIWQRLRSPMLGVSEDLLSVPGVLKLLVYQVLMNGLCQECCWSASEWLVQTERLNVLGQPQSMEQAQCWLEKFVRQTGTSSAALRFRRMQGCSMCVDATGRLGGYGHPLMVAEMIEPGRSGGATFGSDMAPRTRMTRRACAPTYETCSQVALRYVDQGRLDPREYEWRFGLFNRPMKPRARGYRRR